MPYPAVFCVLDRITSVLTLLFAFVCVPRTEIGTRFLSLQPDINNLLTELQSKRGEFDKAGFKILDVRSLIRDSVVIQKDKAGDLGGAVSLESPESHATEMSPRSPD